MQQDTGMLLLYVCRRTVQSVHCTHAAGAKVHCSFTKSINQYILEAHLFSRNLEFFILETVSPHELMRYQLMYM